MKMKNFISEVKNLQKGFKNLTRKNINFFSPSYSTLKELKTYIQKSISEKQIGKIVKDSIKPTTWLNKVQDKVDKVFQGEANLVFLKQSKFWARSITWVLTTGTAFAFGWISIVKTDEVVIAIGRLEPKGGVIDVQMPTDGIASEILVKEGEKVTKGQTLIKLDTEINDAQNDYLRTTLILNENILSKLNILVKEGAISEVQFLEQKNKVENIKSELKAALVRMNYQEIKSPANGSVFNLQPKKAGYVARGSQPVLQIVPDNNLIATVSIDSRTIGFVDEGKRVEISIDSFPSSDFGVIDGTVTRIGSDALPLDQSLGKGAWTFPAKIALDTQYLELKSGKKLPLQAGMSLNANIKLRKVTYLKILLNKFSDKTDTLKSI